MTLISTSQGEEPRPMEHLPWSRGFKAQGSCKIHDAASLLPSCWWVLSASAIVLLPFPSTHRQESTAPGAGARWSSALRLTDYMTPNVARSLSLTRTNGVFFLAQDVRLHLHIPGSNRRILDSASTSMMHETFPSSGFSPRHEGGIPTATTVLRLARASTST